MMSQADGGSGLSLKTVAIIQARLGSRRFARKVLQKFQGRTMIAIMLDRLSQAQTLDEIVVAIPDTPENDELEAHLEGLDCAISRGPEKDVLSRYWHAAQKHGAEVVVRLTADCPLIDPALVDETVRGVVRGNADFVATSELFPDGLDSEAFRVELLEEAFRTANNPSDREHVTSYLHRSYPNKINYLSPPSTLQYIRVTLDEKEDLDVILGVMAAQGDALFSAYDIDRLARSKPKIFQANRHLDRNEGAQMDSGQKLWRRAEKVVAGGNMLLSKHPKMHLPGKWPTYFSKAEGCRVWDLDGREYIDMGFMGVGTNILGYSHPKVDEAVKKAISAGNMSTLNAPEEVELAERLIELHPWADMARFTRSGGEAGTVAIRLARAATGRDRIVFCGYHGWHDWYLAANLADDKNLDGHLLPGLEPSGVPRALKGTSTPFAYNDLQGFRDAIGSGKDVAAIVMEVERSEPPAPGFLEEIRRKATEIDAVLIFDECTSGFRKVLGGHHLTLNVEPDVAIFGKTLGNGYAINAVIGRGEVMAAIRRTFVSSTFWTERIGSAAALATLKELEAENVPARIDQVGQEFRDLAQKVAADAGTGITFSGLSALTLFSLGSSPQDSVKSKLTEAFLERGVLGGSSFYAALPHEVELRRDTYARILFEAFEIAGRETGVAADDSQDRQHRVGMGFHRLA